MLDLLCFELDRKSEFFEFDDNVVFFRPRADFVHDVERIAYVDNENAEVNADKEGINFVKIYPVHRL